MARSRNEDSRDMPLFGKFDPSPSPVHAPPAAPPVRVEPIAQPSQAQPLPLVPGLPPLPLAWRIALGRQVEQSKYEEIGAFVAAERRIGTVYPPHDQVFAAFEATPPDQVKAVLLGQDPYHGPGQAHGLCFSVRPGVPIPPSLVNILQELQNDLGFPPPRHGDLRSWANQGVLMLNTVLTVRSGQANSHRGRGWEEFTDAVIAEISAGPHPVVFILWGNPAKAKRKLIDVNRHAIVQSAHPSPLSAHHGFFGSRPFSQVNRALARFGRAPIDWRLSDP
jgi:uracil-DNA glycosylase